jgi:cell division protein FtsZ
VSGGQSLTMYEVNEAAKVITDEADPNAKVIFGSVIDESLGDEVKITVIATGFGKEFKPKKKISTGSMQYSPMEESEVSAFGGVAREREREKTQVERTAVAAEERMSAARSTASEPAPRPRPQAASREKEEKTAEEQEEEELEIPAFIRKKMM